jgi:hypothetical protein
MVNHLIITTVSHYMAILPLLYNTYYYDYIIIIFISTTFSILWHHDNERISIIYNMDYIFAFIWFMYDMILTNYLTYTLLLNLIIFIINRWSDHCKNYKLYHSIWHLLSALKCFIISYYFIS